MSDELNPYPGNLKRHEVTAEEKKPAIEMSDMHKEDKIHYDLAADEALREVIRAKTLFP